MKYIFIIACLLFSSSCRDSTPQNLVLTAIGESHVLEKVNTDSITGSYLRLNTNQFNFGKINRKKTSKISINFEVENIGKTSLVILKADVSCNCISVEYPKEPIKPNEKGVLTVNIATEAQYGVFNKTIFIKSNAENDVRLIRILGEIKR